MASIPQQPDLSPDDAKFIAGVRRLGARSPATARPVAELPRLRASRFSALLDLGVLREGPAGRFYHYEDSRFTGLPPVASSPVPAAQRLAKLVVFWILLILVAVAAFQLTQ